MAAHVDSVATSGIKAVTKGEFYLLARPGDKLFCSGQVDISRDIERETKSPWSHVLAIWTPGFAGAPWLTLESTFRKGVHVGLLSDYVDRYPGPIVLARRPVLTQAMIEAELNHGFSLLDDGYDSVQEVSIATRKILKFLPLLKGRNDLYCSGLQYAMSCATPYKLKKPLASAPTPEDNWTDPTVEPVCALFRAA